MLSNIHLTRNLSHRHYLACHSNHIAQFTPHIPNYPNVLHIQVSIIVVEGSSVSRTTLIVSFVHEKGLQSSDRGLHLQLHWPLGQAQEVPQLHEQPGAVGRE